MEWVSSKNVDGVRSLMGLAGYCRRFIGEFSQISYSIASLQRKGKNFKWNKECEANFEKLKQLLMHAPILQITNPNKDFLVCTDA